MITGKVWGSTEPVLVAPLFELHRLHVKRKHQCSMHVHHTKWNGFLVLSGELFVDVEKPDMTDTTRLQAGDVTAVKPGEYHRFRTDRRNCVALEFYFTAPLTEDITRKDVGGKVGKP